MTFHFSSLILLIDQWRTTVRQLVETTLTYSVIILTENILSSTIINSVAMYQSRSINIDSG